MSTVHQCLEKFHDFHRHTTLTRGGVLWENRVLQCGLLAIVNGISLLVAISLSLPEN